MPLPRRLAVAMAGAALAFGRPDLYALVLLGFHCFLRPTELLTLRPRDVTFLCKGAKAVITLRGTKTGRRTNTIEQATVDDPLVASALRQACASTASAQRIHAKTARCFGEALKWLARFFQVDRRRLTPHCLRRGGAT